MEQTTQYKAPCELYKKCGGCQLQNLPYDRQLQYKEALVVRLIGKYCRVAPIRGMDDPTHYRHKVQAAFGIDRRRRIISGVYQSSTHRIVPVTSCMIENKEADAIIGTIRSLMPSFKLTAYDERSRTGFLRHVLVRRGCFTGETMVCLVTATPVFPSKNNFVRALTERHPEITTVVQNINAAETSLVLGEREKVLYGPGYIEDKLCGLTFRISARSFYQINPVQTERLYNAAVELAHLTGKETVLDAYCGTGTIGLIASKKAKSVLGVELNRDAVRDAISNAKRNGITNERFICADAGEYMAKVAAEGGERPDVALIDPPRAGCSEEFLRSLEALAPKCIVYVSCNPETLARDLAHLTKNGYRATEARPFDMFPFTKHVECVVCLKRNVK